MSMQEGYNEIRTEFSDRTEKLPTPAESIAKGEAIEMANEANLYEIQDSQSEQMLTSPPTNVMPTFDTQQPYIIDEPEVNEPTPVQSDHLNNVVSDIFEEKDEANDPVLESASMIAEVGSVREIDPHANYDTESNITLKGASDITPADDFLSPTQVPIQKQNITFHGLMNILRDSLIQYKKAPFLQVRLFVLAFLLVGLLVLPGIISGFLLGFYFALTAFLYIFISESEQSSEKERVKEDARKNEIAKDIEVIEDVKGEKIYRGWMDLLNERYNPRTFHVNMLETVTVRLQGHMLHVEHHEKAVLRHAFYEDPTLTEQEPKIIKEDIYDLSDSKIKLRPSRLSSRRWFSRKYPIKIELAFEPLQHGSKVCGEFKNYTESPSEIANSQTSLCSKESDPILDDIPVDRTHDAKQTPMFTENRRTISDIREARKIAEGSGGESEDDYDLISSESEDVLNAAKSQSLKRKSRVVWLFARSSREKEQWFHRLRKASKEYLYPTSDPSDEQDQTTVKIPSIDKIKESREFYIYMLQDVEFRNQLDSIMNEAIVRSDKQWEKTIFMDLGRYKWNRPKTETSAVFIAVINLLVSRITYDFARDEDWIGHVRKKIQTKIGAVHLPYFVETLQLVKFDLGTAIPKIQKVYRPIVDQWGIWIDFDMKYEGSVKLTIETQVDLTRLSDQNEPFDEPAPGTASYFGIPVKNPALAVPDTRYSDEELPLSPEDEPDEEFGAILREKERIKKAKKKPGRKIMQMVDKITHSDIFKGASEIKIVRKALEEISETRMVLNVEITQLEGTMTANIAHPPSDRLWYGFRETPKMSVKATPQIGDKTIAFSTISDWIEGKVVNLFEKFLVFPNLDDFVISLFSGNELLKGGKFTE